MNVSLPPDDEEWPEPSQEPGWYRNPDDPLRHRYWTGQRWLTEEQFDEHAP